jgi:hypothetical protein
MTTRAQSRVMPLTDPLLAYVPMPFQEVYYPCGFPVQIKSTARVILEAAEQSWGTSRQRFEKSPVEVRYIISNGPKRRSAFPVFRAQCNILTMVADEHNYACGDLLRGFGSAWLTETAVNDFEYFRYTFLEGLVYVLLENLHYVPIHAACVIKDGHGVLLAAESGMGKSSLAYACACRGWTYVSDDASSFIHGGTGRKVIGNPRLFRFRPTAADLFPELRRDGILEPRSRPKFRRGKPTVEVRTESLPHIQVADEATIDYLVFLKRDLQMNGTARLVPVSREAALRRLLHDVWPAELPLHEQRSAAIERLLGAELCELSYCDIVPAVDVLEQFVHRGL